MDDFSDLLGLGEDATPAEKQQALAMALRRMGPGAAPPGAPGAGSDLDSAARMQETGQQKSLGTLFQLSGDRVLAPAGTGLLSRAEQTERAQALAPYRQQMAANGAAGVDVKRQLLGLKTQDQLDQENHVGKYAPKMTSAISGDTAVTTNQLTGEVATTKTNARKLTRPGGPGGPPAAPISLETATPAEIGLAKDYHSIGPKALAVFGRDTAAKKRIVDLHGAMFGNQGASGSTSDFTADNASLVHAQTQADAIKGFIGTFDKNQALLETAASKLESSNSPFLNKGLRWFQENAEGDPALTEFKILLNAVGSEAAKVNTGSTGAGGAPVSVIAEIEHNLPANATPRQIVAALRAYRHDSESRLKSSEEVVQGIKARRGGQAAPSPAPTAAPAAGGDLKARQSARIKQLIDSGVNDQAKIRATLESEGLGLPKTQVAAK